MAIRESYYNSYGQISPRNTTGLLEFVSGDGTVVSRHDTCNRSHYMNAKIELVEDPKEVCPFTQDLISGLFIRCYRNHPLSLDQFITSLKYGGKDRCPLCMCHIRPVIYQF